MINKKFLVLMFIVLFVVGGLFAQPEVPFDFIIGAGMHLQFIEGNDQPELIMRARDDKRLYAFDGYMQGRYNFQGRAGVDFRVEYGAAPDSFLFFRHYASFIWGQFFNRQIYIRGGYLTGGFWGGGGAGDFIKEEWGYELRLDPDFIKGLDFGVGVFPAFHRVTLDEWKYVAGFNYIMDGVFNIRASFCNIYIPGRKPSDPLNLENPGRTPGQDGMMTALLEVWPIPGMTLNISTMIPDLFQFRDVVKPEFYTNLTYSTRGWTFGVNTEWFNMNGAGLDRLTYHDHRKRDWVHNVELFTFDSDGNEVLYNPDNKFLLNAEIFVRRDIGNIWKFGSFIPTLNFRVNSIMQPMMREYIVSIESPVRNRAVAREIFVGYSFGIFEQDLETRRWFNSERHYSAIAHAARHRHDLWLVFMWRI
jgi:hypothetical protein